MFRKVDPRTRARALRQRATPAEKEVWGLLRGRRMLGLKFRRQHPIGGFVVDFACLQHRLVLELDGSHHATPQQRAYDEQRDTALAGYGYRVLRVPNDQVSPQRLEELIRHAVPELAERPPSQRSGKGGTGGEEGGRRILPSCNTLALHQLTSG